MSIVLHQVQEGGQDDSIRKYWYKSIPEIHVIELADGTIIEVGGIDPHIDITSFEYRQRCKGNKTHGGGK